MLLPRSSTIRTEVAILVGFILEIMKSNRLLSSLVIASSAAAAASQASILFLLNYSLVASSASDLSILTPGRAIVLALTFAVIAAWFQFIASRLTVSIWIARRNQNLIRLDDTFRRLCSGELINSPEFLAPQVQNQIAKVLLLLRSLNNRQGLAVRASFGVITTGLSLLGIIIGALIINAPVTLMLCASGIFLILPFTLRHGAKMVSADRAFRYFTSHSSRSFKASVRSRLLQGNDSIQDSFGDDPHYVQMNRALVSRITTPDWNRVIVATLLFASLPLFLILGLSLGYEIPRIETLIVLLIALLAALTQIAALSGTTTVLGRFRDTITGFENAIVPLRLATTESDLDEIERTLRTAFGPGQEAEDI